MSMRSTNGEVDDTDQLLTELSNGPHSADVLRALLDALLVQKEDDDVLMGESSSHQSDEHVVSPQVMSKISNIFVEKLKIRNFTRQLSNVTSPEAVRSDVNSNAWLYFHCVDEEKRVHFLDNLLDATDAQLRDLDLNYACLLCENDLFMKRYFIYVMNEESRLSLRFIVQNGPSDHVKQQARSLQLDLKWDRI